MGSDLEVNIDNQCPQCGAVITSGNVCEYCGARISYEEHKDDEAAGQNGAFGQDGSVGQGTYSDGDNISQAINKHLVWWILGWVFIFPVPVMILIWRPKCTWKLPVKVIVTVLFWLLFFVIQMIRNGNLTTNINVHY